MRRARLSSYPVRVAGLTHLASRHSTAALYHLYLASCWSQNFLSLSLHVVVPSRVCPIITEGLVNQIQRACTVLGDYGGANNNAFSSLLEALPSVAVVGGQIIITTTTTIIIIQFRKNKNWTICCALEPLKMEFHFRFLDFNSLFLFLVFWNKSRVRGSLRFWRALLGMTFCLEDQVSSFLFFYLVILVLDFFYFFIMLWVLVLVCMNWIAGFVKAPIGVAAKCNYSLFLNVKLPFAAKYSSSSRTSSTHGPKSLKSLPACRSVKITSFISFHIYIYSLPVPFVRVVNEKRSDF